MGSFFSRGEKPSWFGSLFSWFRRRASPQRNNRTARGKPRYQGNQGAGVGLTQSQELEPIKIPKNRSLAISPTSTWRSITPVSRNSSIRSLSPDSSRGSTRKSPSKNAAGEILTNSPTSTRSSSSKSSRSSSTRRNSASSRQKRATHVYEELKKHAETLRATAIRNGSQQSKRNANQAEKLAASARTAKNRL